MILIFFAFTFTLTLMAITYGMVKYNLSFEYFKYYITLSSGIGVAYFTAITIDNIKNHKEYVYKIQILLSFPYIFTSTCLLFIIYFYIKKKGEKI